MTTLREAARQAMEALKLIDESMPFPVAKHAQAALKAALAQQEQEPPEQPIDYFAVQRIANERGLDYNRFAAALRDYAALAQQEQEPVAWMEFRKNSPPVVVPRDLGTPVYTHPPRREAQQEPVEIKPPNPEGATQCIVRWLAETPAGWVGAWDREALERFTAHPPRREWRGLTEEAIRELSFHNQQTLWPRPDRSAVRATAIPFARAIEAALKEKNHE